MSSVVRKRRACVIAEPCSCGCGVLLMPDTSQWSGRYGDDWVAFASSECFGRFLEQLREPRCACGAPSDSECSCGDAFEADSTEALGLQDRKGRV